MPISYDCSQDANVVVIEGIVCNCNSKKQKEVICSTISSMNSDEQICIERRRFNNPNIQPYNWSVTPIVGNGLSILNNGVVAVTVYSQPADIAQIYQIFLRQINAGTNWCQI